MVDCQRPPATKIAGATSSFFDCGKTCVIPRRIVVRWVLMALVARFFTVTTRRYVPGTSE